MVTDHLWTSLGIMADGESVKHCVASKTTPLLTRNIPVPAMPPPELAAEELSEDDSAETTRSDDDDKEEDSLDNTDEADVTRLVWEGRVEFLAFLLNKQFQWQGTNWNNTET